MRSNRPDAIKQDSTTCEEAATVTDESSRPHSDVLPAEVVRLVARWLLVEIDARYRS